MRGLIVICAYGNLPLTKQCFESALKQSVPVDVLVFDNGSGDGTAAWLRSLRTEGPVWKISLRNSVSVACMWNMALDWAWLRFEEALVCNNDIVLQPTTYELLRTHMRKTGYGMVTGVSIGENAWFGMPPSWKRDGEKLQAGEISESPHPDFSGFMIARGAHQRVRFNADYAGAYCEDADWHVRAHRAGIKAVSIDVPFLHRRSSTLRSAAEVEVERINAAADANRQRFFREYGCVPGTKKYEELFK